MEINNYNLSIMEKYRPNLYKTYLKLLEELPTEEISVSKIEAKDGSYALCVNKENETIRLNSVYRPLEEARKWAESYNFPSINTVVEMFGLGNGVFTREVINKLKPDDVLIIYEPSFLIFSYCIQQFDITDILTCPNVYLFVEGINELGLEDCLLQKIYWYNKDLQRQITHPQYAKMLPEKYNWYLERIKNNNDLAEINNNTDAHLGKLAVNNMLKNIKYLIGSNLIKEIKEKLPEGVPAIIVSAGPSLRKNINQLRLAKGKSVIIAVDTVMPYLEKEGIEPDVLITIDPRKSLRHFQGEFSKQIPMISKLEARPEVLDLNQSRKIFYSSHKFMESLYNIIGIKTEDYTSGGSVATAAFSVCVAMDFKRVVFVGQDLAYEGEFTHIGERKETFKGDRGEREVEGVNGEPVKTRYDWFIYLNWFKNSIHINPQIDFIDATEGGAKIQGTRIMTLQEVTENYCTKEFDFGKVLHDTSPTLDENGEKLISNYLHEAYEDLFNIRKKSEEILGKIYKAITIYKTKGLTKELQDISSKITEMSGAIERKHVYSVIDTFMTEFARKHMNTIYKMDSQEDDTLKTFSLARDMYENMINVTSEIEPLMLKAVEEYDQRMGK